MESNLLKKLLNPYNLRINLFSLNFIDIQKEKEFREDYQAKSVSFILPYMALGTIIYMSFGFFYTFSEEIIIRYAIITPLMIIATIFIYFKIVKKYIHLILTAIAILLGFSLIFMMIFAKKNPIDNAMYFIGLMLIVFGINILMRLRLLYMVIINFTILILYVLADVLFVGLINISKIYFSLNVLHLFSANLIGCLAASNIEYFYRNDFDQKKIILEQANELKKSNETMEVKVKERTRELEIERTKSLKAIIEGQELERQRIAQDLHDSLGIRLISLKRSLEPALSANQNYILADIDKIINQVREISHNLLPYALKHLGLIKAIEDLCHNIRNNYNLEVGFSKVNIKDNERWNYSLETELFRIVQELITNIIRHADANKISVELIKDENILFLTVEDNGKGYNHQESNHKGAGLRNIEARVSLLGGTKSVDSRPQNGTTVMINIPL